MDLFVSYFQAVFGLLAESAPYLLLGFVLAGLLKVLVPEEKVYKHLGQDNFKSVGLASLFGIPIPLCSCSVLPTAMSLKKSGASKGATASFLISTPETGLDSIGITYALLDPIMTIMRPVGALLSALATGSVVNLFVRRGWDRGTEQKEPPDQAAIQEAEASCCSHQEKNASDEQDPGHAKEHDHGHDHDHDHDHAPAPAPEPGSRRSPLQVGKDACRYAFGPLLDDLTPWFILGFLISGIIAMAVPDGFFEEYVSQRWAASLLMLIIGTPVYICAAATTPVAAMLIAKGLDPGAALVLLLVGPATNASTILVVYRFLGKTVLGIYLVCMTVMALLLGFVVNLIYDWSGLEIDVQLSEAMAMGSSTFAIGAALFILVLMILSARRIRLLSTWGAQVRRWCAPFGLDPTSGRWRVAALVALLVAYLLQGVQVVTAGEVGWVLRFGKVVRTVEQPGLVVHLPPPFEKFTSLRTSAVHAVDVGFIRENFVVDADNPADFGGVQTDADESGRDLEEEAEVMTGEEGLLKLSYTVHYVVQEAFEYQFRIARADELVRAVAESAVRQVVALRTTESILVADRDLLEADALEIMQDELEVMKIGVEVRRVAILDIHAPVTIHHAFRDVASSLEDKARAVRQAEGYETETLAGARADAYLLEQEAGSYETNKVLLSEGQAAGFVQRLEAYRESREITELRLFLEAQEKALEQARVIYLLGEDIEVDLMNVTGEGVPVLRAPDR